MKKLLSLALAAVILLLSGCSKPENPPNSEAKKETSGVWISYIELDEMVESGDFKTAFTAAADNCADFGITDIFLHVSPFCDAIYPSKIYHKRYADTGVDPLKTAVSVCHKRGMRLHAWINPYRVKTGDNDINSLSENSLAYRWAFDADGDNDKNVLVCEGGIFLNPLEAEVRQTVISVAREILTGYNVDGIHIDDYFYPVTDEVFDGVSYGEYIKQTEKPLPLADYRRACVNALISGLYTAVKFINKDAAFSVSPAADINKNYEKFYADVKSWCQSGCVDMIIPQLYFGFHYKNERFCFDNILKEWKELSNGGGAALLVGLGVYKTGTATEADGEEWINDDDILSRQTGICKSDSEIQGVVYYSYSSLFSENDINTRARNNIKNVSGGA